MNTEIFNNILDEVFYLPFSHTDKIINAERKIYKALQQQPANVCGLISLMFVQIMQGKQTEAKETANRIWSIGGNIPTDFELLFIENLLNVGLLNMASGLLKVKFENLKNNIDDFYSVLTKFSIMTGSISLLKRLQAFSDEQDYVLFEFADLFEQALCSTQFKDIQKIVIDNVSKDLCAYEYDLYDDEGYPELVVSIYLNKPNNYCQQQEAELNEKIAAYWISSQKNQLYNLSFELKNISSHDSWFED